MKQEDVNQIAMQLTQLVPPTDMYQIRKALEETTMEAQDIFPLISALKNPTTMLLISIFIGILGVDRFMLGDVGLGIGKLLTAGLCGIWAIVDWFLIVDATKKKNAIFLLSNIS